MYTWYANSACCYVFLKDVDHGDFYNDPQRQAYVVRHWYNDEEQPCISEMPARFLAGQFESSVWFTRTWTLQELLAPRDLLFYNNQFYAIGSRLTMSVMIARTTGIGHEYLDGQDCGRESVRLAPVAERMKWASHRRATRKEDIAYSLLGILDVNMPLLYGEGERAFSRLQSEVVKRSDDQSVFIWDSAGPCENTSLLAPNIHCFAKVETPLMKVKGWYSLDYEETNKGLKVTGRFDKNELETCLTTYGSAIFVMPTGHYSIPRNMTPDQWIVQVKIRQRTDVLVPMGSLIRLPYGFSPTQDLAQALDCPIQTEVHHKPTLMGYRVSPRSETMPEVRRWTDEGLPIIYPDPYGTEYVIYIPNEVVWTEPTDVPNTVPSPFQSSSLDVFEPVTEERDTLSNVYGLSSERLRLATPTRRWKSDLRTRGQVPGAIAKELEDEWGQLLPRYASIRDDKLTTPTETTQSRARG